MSWAALGRIFVRMLAGDARSGSSGRNLGVVAAWSALAFVLAWHGYSFAAADPASSACEPITFAVEGSPPPFVGAELELAMQEMQARTDLVFEPQAESEGGRRPKLLVSWAVGEASRPASALAVSGRGTPGRLGYGSGRWREAEGRREFLEGAVEINGNVPWRRGLDASQAGAGVRSWTESDAAQLAQLGRLAGCRR